ncbi:hypothetical protein BLOT_008447 [Blomia tropicalis]|nr:hypothetical protein BLOT_008447 [Blomia tropicalis]
MQVQEGLDFFHKESSHPLTGHNHHQPYGTMELNSSSGGGGDGGEMHSMTRLNHTNNNNNDYNVRLNGIEEETEDETEEDSDAGTEEDEESVKMNQHTTSTWANGYEHTSGAGGGGGVTATPYDQYESHFNGGYTDGKNSLEANGNDVSPGRSTGYYSQYPTPESANSSNGESISTRDVIAPTTAESLALVPIGGTMSTANTMMSPSGRMIENLTTLSPPSATTAALASNTTTSTNSTIPSYETVLAKDCETDRSDFIVSRTDKQMLTLVFWCLYLKVQCSMSKYSNGIAIVGCGGNM